MNVMNKSDNLNNNLTYTFSVPLVPAIMFLSFTLIFIVYFLLSTRFDSLANQLVIIQDSLSTLQKDNESLVKQNLFLISENQKLLLLVNELALNPSGLAVVPHALSGVNLPDRTELYRDLIKYAFIVLAVISLLVFFYLSSHYVFGLLVSNPLAQWGIFFNKKLGGFGPPKSWLDFVPTSPGDPVTFDVVTDTKFVLRFTVEHLSGGNLGVKAITISGPEGGLIPYESTINQFFSALVLRYPELLGANNLSIDAAEMAKISAELAIQAAAGG